MPLPGEQVRDLVADQRAADRDTELAVLLEVGPPHRAGVPAAVDPLERRYQPLRRFAAARRRPRASGAGVPPARAPAAARRAARGSAWPGAARCGPSRARAGRRPSTQTLTGSSVRSIRCATIACSARFFALVRSCSPRWSSTAGSALRRVVPASATVCARAPSRRTSSSGLAPTNAASGVPTQNE